MPLGRKPQLRSIRDVIDVYCASAIRSFNSTNNIMHPNVYEAPRVEADLVTRERTPSLQKCMLISGWLLLFTSQFSDFIRRWKAYALFVALW